MQNPILQRLNQNQNQSNSLFQRLNMAKSFLSGKNPDALYADLMKNNKQFKNFADSIQGKTIDEIAMEYDLDANLLKKFL